MKNLYAGIDFGTTNTTAAIGGINTPPKIVLLDGHSVIPTTIFFEKDTNKFFWGNTANEKYMNAEEGRFMRSLKRVFGTDLMKIGTVINGKRISYQDIIGTFIKNVKTELDIAAEAEIESVVMGRPVRFCDNDLSGDLRAEQELEEVAKNAGFKNVLFQYEPVAAAFAHETHLKEEQLAIVIDIGGGTSDFTVIRLGGECIKKSDRKNDILANTGIRIGGNDFDKQFSLKAFMPEFGMGTKSGSEPNYKILSVPTAQYFDLSEWSQINSLYTYKNINIVKEYLVRSQDPEKYGRLMEVLEKQLGHKVLSVIENAKISLTDHESIKVLLDFLSSKTELKINRKDFEESIEVHTIKILYTVNECLKLANISSEKIQLIVLTGGSTEIPYVRDMLCNIFPNARVSDENKLSSVGLGLAFDAVRRFTHKIS